MQPSLNLENISKSPLSQPLSKRGAKKKGVKKVSRIELENLQTSGGKPSMTVREYMNSKGGATTNNTTARQVTMDPLSPTKEDEEYDALKDLSVSHIQVSQE